MLAQELMHINVVKGIKDTIGAKTFMGRASIPIRPFADRPGEPVTDWYDMGKGEWSNDDGTVSHSLAHCPWHTARLPHRGGLPSRIVHFTMCLTALQAVSPALQRGMLLICALQMITGTTCAVCLCAAVSGRRTRAI